MAGTETDAGVTARIRKDLSWILLSWIYNSLWKTDNEQIITIVRTVTKENFSVPWKGVSSLWQ